MFYLAKYFIFASAYETFIIIYFQGIYFPFQHLRNPVLVS